MKRFKRVVWITLIGVVGLYLIDDLVARLRSRGSVDVDVFYAVNRKDGRIDYMRSDPQTESCVNSLLAHIELEPCWYLTRHPRKEVEVGVQRNDFWRRL